MQWAKSGIRQNEKTDTTATKGKHMLVRYGWLLVITAVVSFALGFLAGLWDLVDVYMQ